MKKQPSKKKQKGNNILLSDKTLNAVNIVISALFIAMTFWMLACDGANYLRKIELLSLFLPTKTYFADCMAQPGGLLTWISTWLTQSFYHPWLGATAYAVILAAISLVSYKSVKLPKAAYPVTLIVPALILLALLDLGYTIYSNKTPGVAFLLPVGVLVIMLIFWAFVMLHSWGRVIAIIAVSIAGYCLLGIYGLAATAVCGIYCLMLALKQKGTQRWISLASAVIGALCISLVPKLWLKLIGGDLMMIYTYQTPLPRFFETESYMFTPYILIAVCLGIYAIISAVNNRNTTEQSSGAVLAFGSMVVGLAAIISVITLRYDDPNLKLSLAIDHELWQGDWQKAADLATEAGDLEFTRANVILADMALLRAGEIGDKMFVINNSSAPYETQRALRAAHDITSRMFSYHTGMINYAYRWAMEYKVEYGMSAEQLMFMTKAALLNKDYNVARKCLDQLSMTAFHRDWAAKYRKYVDDPSLIAEDEEMSMIIPLMDQYNVFINDGGRLEGYVWEALAYNNLRSKQALELSLASALMTKKIDVFMAKIGAYARQVDKLPKHFQEAILVWSAIETDFDFKPYNLDQQVIDKFNQFMNMSGKIGKLPKPKQAELLKPAFGDTFMFYYLHNSDRTII